MSKTGHLDSLVARAAENRNGSIFQVFLKQYVGVKKFYVLTLLPPKFSFASEMITQQYFSQYFLSNSGPEFDNRQIVGFTVPQNF